ncbi:hypothetical protein [Tateyamaria sp.]|uniref:hypothetical protein n=1 Tax=Tateyamaria sp. TaxID=1929288 RepID=UPI003B212457
MKLLVTDHAVLRYLERGWGVDVAALRRHIAREAAGILHIGPAPAELPGLDEFAVISRGLRYRFKTTGDGTPILVTVTPAGARATANRALRMRLRQKGRS